MFKDPVCGMIVDEKRTKWISEHDGAKYYFCSDQCKRAFDSDPRKFVKA